MHALTRCVSEFHVPHNSPGSGRGFACLLCIPCCIRNHHDLHQVMQTSLHHLQLQTLARRQVPQKCGKELPHLRDTRVLQGNHDFSEVVVTCDHVFVFICYSTVGEILQRSQHCDLHLGVRVAYQADKDWNGPVFSERGRVKVN